jgi:hypothetical protein
VLFANILCLVVRSGPSSSPPAVFLQPVEGDLEPSHPIAVTFPSRSEAIDATLGTQLRSPRVVPDETKLAVADCASRDFTGSRTFGAVGHWCPLFGFIVAVRRSSLTLGFHEPVRRFHAYSLSRSRSEVQLNAGRRRRPKGIGELYEGLPSTVDVHPQENR